MTIKELIFGTNDTTHKVKTYPVFGDYKFKTDEKKLKEFEEELGIERKYNKLPWEVK